MNNLKSNLSWAFNNKNADSIKDLSIPSDTQTLLLYNTNDLCLSEAQFNALTASIAPADKFYVFQSDSDKIYEFDYPMTYDEYQALELFSITYLTSDKFDWAVVIDENLESGIGILAAKSGVIERFSARYGNCLNDIQELIAFHYRDASRNPHSIGNLIKILAQN